MFRHGQSAEIKNTTSLIKLLQRIEERHGNVPVALLDPDTFWLMRLYVQYSKRWGVGLSGSYEDVTYSDQNVADDFNALNPDDVDADNVDAEIHEG